MLWREISNLHNISAECVKCTRYRDSKHQVSTILWLKVQNFQILWCEIFSFHDVLAGNCKFAIGYGLILNRFF